MVRAAGRATSRHPLFSGGKAGFGAARFLVDPSPLAQTIDGVTSGSTGAGTDTASDPAWTVDRVAKQKDSGMLADPVTPAYHPSGPDRRTAVRPEGQPVQSTRPGNNITRKPMTMNRTTGVNLRRYAARQPLGPSRQEPPRRTRAVPDVGPFGSRAPAFA